MITLPVGSNPALGRHVSLLRGNIRPLSRLEIPRLIGIADNLELTIRIDVRIGQFRYNGPFGIDKDKRADKCTECGECLEKCPQSIDIPSWLKKAHEAMYTDKPIGPR